MEQGKRTATILVVEDDKGQQTNGFALEVETGFERVVFKETVNDALAFVNDNLPSKIIILLDLGFPKSEEQGVYFLNELRKQSRRIPVIIWSGRDDIEGAEYQEIINGSTFAFLSKSASSEEIMEILRKADDYLNSQIDTAVESWLESHSEEERKKPFLKTSDGQSYSMEDLLREIRMQTPFGKKIALDINKLTIDLLFRKKEQI